jgi:hypothetical protein
MCDFNLFKNALENGAELKFGRKKLVLEKISLGECYSIYISKSIGGLYKQLLQTTDFDDAIYVLMH